MEETNFELEERFLTADRLIGENRLSEAARMLEEILAEANAFDADAIVLRAARWRWWRRTLGRVAARVRARAEVPVLLLSEVAS